MNDYIPVSDKPSDCNKGQIRPIKRCKLDVSLFKAEFMTYDKRDNCFNFIRLIAALQVFFGHASEHLFVPMPSGVKEIWWAFRGVPIFFILSGFLIWNSLERQTSFFTYCKKRLLRLYPELYLQMVYYDELNMSKMMEDLGEKYGVDYLTIQSGGTLNNELVRQGLVDYVHVVIAPLLVGGKSTNTLLDGKAISSVAELGKLKALELLEVNQLENSYLELKYRVKNEKEG